MSMTVLDMDNIIRDGENSGVTQKEFIKQLSLNDLKTYCQVFKNEKQIIDADFINIRKVGLIAFDIASMFHYKQ